MAYTDSSAYQDVYKQINRGGGAGDYWNPQRTSTTLDQYGNDFSQQFQNAVGRAPTADEINQFYSQAVSPIMNTQAGFSSTDPNAVASQFIPQAFQSQIQQGQQSKLGGLEQQIGQVSSNVGTQTASQLSDPNSAAYQQFAGGMNNLGITPSAGAFQAGVGGQVGESASNTMQSLLSSLGGGAISGNQSPSFQSLFGMGQQAGQGMASQNQGLSNFNLEAQLAQSLANSSQQSTAQKDIGMASGASQAAGNLAKGGAALGATWICTSMKEAGVISTFEIRDLHYHLYKAWYKRPLKFLGYILFGKCLVWMANSVGTDWRVWKTQFVDQVLKERDPEKAVDIYAMEFWNLFEVVRWKLMHREEKCHG